MTTAHFRAADGATFSVDTGLARVRRMRRRVTAWARVAEGLRVQPDLYMVTLTYRGVDDWRPGHISEFMARVSAWCPGLLGYAWVSELQQRGALHYHVMLALPPGVKPPHADSAGWWSHGMTRTERARSWYYLVKYATKATGDEARRYPYGARMFRVCWRAAGQRLARVYDMFVYRITALTTYCAALVSSSAAALQDWTGWRWRRRLGYWSLYHDSELTAEYRSRTKFLFAG